MEKQYHKVFAEDLVKASPEGEEHPQSIKFEDGILTIDQLKRRVHEL